MNTELKHTLIIAAIVLIELGLSAVFRGSQWVNWLLIVSGLSYGFLVSRKRGKQE